MPWDSKWPLSPATGPFILDTDPTYLHYWPLVKQLWDAKKERHWMVNNLYHPWPDVGAVWWPGTISAIVDNGDGSFTITDDTLGALPGGGIDDGRFWNGGERSSDCGTHPPYWVGVNCGNQPYLNGMYDVIVEYDVGDGTDPGTEWYRTLKEWYPIRGNITANTNNTLTFTGKVNNFVTAKCIPSLASLVGKRYYILRTGRPWWSDINPNLGRYPDWPNEGTLWRGSFGDDDKGRFYTDGTGYILENRNKFNPDPYNNDELPVNGWRKDLWKDKEVLHYNTTGDLFRKVPTGNNGNTIFFGGLDHIPTTEEEATLTTDYDVAGDFSVVVPDSRGFPERKNWQIWRWNFGLHYQYYGHGPTYDGASPALNTLPRYPAIIAGDDYKYHAVDSIDLVGLCASDDGPPLGSLVTVNSLDNDIHTPVQNFCTPADFFPAPQIHKSFRQLEKDIEDFIGECVRPISYSGAKEIQNYSIALCFLDCGINAGTSTVEKDSVTVGTVTTTRYYFIADGDDYKNQFLYYEIIQDGKRANQFSYDGATSNADGRVDVFSTTDGDTTLHDANWLGATAYWTAGWSRAWPLLAAYFYQRWIFIPDIDQDDLGNRFAIFPPAINYFDTFGCFGVGRWIKLPASTSYKIYSERGEAQDGDGRDYIPGDVVRLHGDTYHDPGTGITVRDGEAAEELPFWDRSFFGKHKRQIQQRVIADLSGTITSSNKFSFTDSTKNWLRDWYEGGELITHNFTASGGSTTTFVTEDGWNDPSNPNNCWFDGGGRFPGFTVPFKDFVFQFDKTETDPDGNDVTVTYKVPVTDVTNSGLKKVFHFAEVDRKYGGGTATVDIGDAGRLVEPDTKLARFIGRRVEITKPDKTRVDIDANISDDDTIFHDALTDPLPVGSVYKIIDYYPGGNWMFSTTPPTPEEKAAGVPWQKIGTDKYFIGVHGADPRGLGDWLEEMTPAVPVARNEPHNRKGFGRMRKGDYIWYVMLNQAYHVLNKLRHVKRGTLSWWIPDDVDNAGGFEVFEEGLRWDTTNTDPGLNTTLNDAWADFLDHEQVIYDTSAYAILHLSAGPPSTHIDGPDARDGDFGSNPPPNSYGDLLTGQRTSSFSYPQATVDVTLMPSATDLYVMGGMYGGETPADDTDWPQKSVHRFNPDGSGLLLGEFVLVDSLPPTKDVLRQSTVKVGSDPVSKPVFTKPDDPLGHTVTSPTYIQAEFSQSEGFTVAQTAVVLKFDVEGGLEFIA
jgi:hypothetical protein